MKLGRTANGEKDNKRLPLIDRLKTYNINKRNLFKMPLGLLEDDRLKGSLIRKKSALNNIDRRR